MSRIKNVKMLQHSQLIINIRESRHTSSEFPPIMVIKNGSGCSREENNIRSRLMEMLRQCLAYIIPMWRTSDL